MQTFLRKTFRYNNLQITHTCRYTEYTVTKKRNGRIAVKFLQSYATLSFVKPFAWLPLTGDFGGTSDKKPVRRY